MTDEMFETFLKLCDYDPPEKDHEYYEIALQRYNDNVESARESYHAYGTVGNATLCAIYHPVSASLEMILHFTLGDYIITLSSIPYSTANTSELRTYLYQDGVFTTLEHGLEEGLITPDELYECVTANPDPLHRLKIMKSQDSDMGDHSYPPLIEGLYN